jgi:hypothetical protein
MEQEHFIIIALLCVVVYMLSTRQPCGCVVEGFEKDMITAGHIRSRREGGLGLVNADTPISYIRNREDTGQGFNLGNQRINVNNNMNQSQFVKHHLKMDHRSKMLKNMAGCEGPDCAGAF